MLLFQELFNKALEDAYAKLAEMEKLVSSDDVGKDLRGVRDLLKKHQVRACPCSCVSVQMRVFTCTCCRRCGVSTFVLVIKICVYLTSFVTLVWRNMGHN